VLKKTLMILAVIAVATAAADDGARLLIVVADGFETTVQPLASWKRASGITARVVRLSSIGADTGAIRSYIRDAWASWPVRPENILLVGSPEVLPSFYYSAPPFDYASDHSYGDLGGDEKPEVPVGRFPAKSVRQCSIMVSKTLLYERTPFTEDPLWFTRMTSLVRDGGDADDTVYHNDARCAALLAAGAGWLPLDSLSTRQGDDESTAIRSINEGRGLVMYRGTAGGWWRSPFNVRPTAVANDRKLPIVLSATCATVTLTPGESMVGEAWVKTGPTGITRGAVAFVGNTHSDNNVARVRGAFARGFLSGLFAEKIATLGDLLVRGKQQLRTEFPTRTHDYRGFNLLGDPSLRVWTATPHQVTVTHPGVVFTGPQSLPVQVSAGGLPARGALVCASIDVDTLAYAWGWTDQQGAVTLAVSPADTGRLRLVVTGTNIYPYDITIPIALTGVAAEAAAPVAYGGDFAAVPSVASGEITFRWRGPAARLDIISAAGVVVNALVPVAATCRWNGRTAPGDPAPPGVYLCVLRDGLGRVAGSTRVVKLR
jgi:hypothetical protein